MTMRFPDFRSSIRYKVTVLSGLIALGAPLLIYNLYDETCGWAGGVSTRASTFASPRYFQWTNVSRVTAGCGNGRSRGAVFVTLLMRDGTAIPLPLSAPTKEIYQKLGLALRGVPFTYDASAGANCNSTNAALVAMAPS